jgi:hypothetical protein
LSEEEKKRFEAVLLERIDPDRGYLCVTYFIVCALWKAGKLPEALGRVKPSYRGGNEDVRPEQYVHDVEQASALPLSRFP